jgi:hypothetical protein
MKLSIASTPKGTLTTMLAFFVRELAIIPISICVMIKYPYPVSRKSVGILSNIMFVVSETRSVSVLR